MKKILFLTGTRADFGKIKSLIQILEQQQGFEIFVFVTGMHLLKEYGYTLIAHSILYAQQNNDIIDDVGEIKV